jgi:hypothetical protein
MISLSLLEFTTIVSSFVFTILNFLSIYWYIYHIYPLLISDRRPLNVHIFYDMTDLDIEVDSMPQPIEVV